MCRNVFECALNGLTSCWLQTAEHPPPHYVSQSAHRYEELLTKIDQRSDAVINLTHSLASDVNDARLTQEHLYDVFNKVGVIVCLFCFFIDCEVQVRIELSSSTSTSSQLHPQSLPPKDPRDVVRKMPFLFGK